MSGKSTKKPHVVRFEHLDDVPPSPPLTGAAKAMEDDEIMRRAAADPDMGLLPDGFWATATVREPDLTQQITLRLPRRVISHFKATGKGYHSRISAVLAAYVDAADPKAR